MQIESIVLNFQKEKNKTFLLPLFTRTNSIDRIYFCLMLFISILSISNVFIRMCVCVCVCVWLNGMAANAFHL